jgi:lipopolysaccharide/colanic/teichoic acid biosynthesis glycosyltransferase
VGQFGRPFRVVKLRTMRTDAEADGPAFARPADPRVTRVGRLLRHVRLDELPQLLNVLKGDMSLVGPRPERPEFLAELARAVPYYTFRLAVPPGLTGWAQVNMPYARSEEEHRLKLEYDLYFIRERSFGMYLLTLLRTISVALVGARR